jgi:mutator protein MutT
MTTVVAAIIEREQKILVCQRKGNGPHAWKWEFPGGKVESGESLTAALERELREELAIDAQVAEEIARYEFAYPGKPAILLVFFAVSDFDGVPENRVFERIEWSARETLANYDFLEGDADFVRSLISRV